MNEKITLKAINIVKNSTECYVGVISEDGYPHVATRSAISSDGINSCYFSTNTSGNLASIVTKNSKMSICFRDENDNVTLIGDGNIVTDINIKKKLWIDWFINHFAGGPSDPEFCIIKFETKKVSLWVNREISKFSL